MISSNFESESYSNGEAWRVYYFKKHNVHIMHNGHFNSYESFDEYEFEEDAFSEVVPKQKTITIYEPIKN